MDMDDRPQGLPPQPPGGGKLAENIMHFARVLRGAGLPVGSGQVLDGIEAAQTGCLRNKTDFHAALHSVFVKRHEHEVWLIPMFRTIDAAAAGLRRRMRRGQADRHEKNQRTQAKEHP